MKKFKLKKFKYFGLTIFLVATISFILLGLLGNQGTQNNSTIQKNTQKGYMLGVSGFTPAYFPNSTTEDLLNYWSEISDYTDIYGVHTSIDGLNILDTAAPLISVPIELVTGIPQNETWGQNRDRLLNTLTAYLNKYSQIKYLAIGNEVNVHYDLETSEFNDFFETYRYLYTELKNKFPNLQISATFQYEALIGKGFLMGKQNLNEVEMLKIMEDYLDVVSLTVYPYFDYKTPSEVPLNYFSSITEVVSKSIVITETGWISREIYPASYSALTEQGYSGSEDEQVQYLKKLVEIIKEYNLLFANWTGLNDFYAWEDGKDPVKGHEIYDSIGLKDNSGNEKKIWDEWKKIIVK